MPSSKFHRLEDLLPLIAAEKSRGRIVALANGGFDLFHVGHVRYLQAAKALADILIVAINSDRSLQALKGANRALIDQDGRVAIVSALACVDYVTLFPELTADRVLLAIKPHIHCKGGDYTAATVPERDSVASFGGRVAIVGGEKIRSTSHLIQAIKRLHG